MTTLDLLVNHGAASADVVALATAQDRAVKIKAIVRRALECLIANKLIEVVPMENWPEYVILDPTGWERADDEHRTVM